MPNDETWEAAWEREKLAVGEEVHKGWMEEKLAQGFVDHPYRFSLDGGGLPCCSQLYNKHHTDMLPFAELPPHVQEYDFKTGVIAFRRGYEARQREVEAD